MSSNEVQMPEPDVYRYDHWAYGSRVEWSPIQLDYTFSTPCQPGYVKGEPHFSLPKLRAYADARCAQENALLIGLLADIRKAAGDPTGKLDWTELVAHVAALAANDRRYRWLRNCTADEEQKIMYPESRELRIGPDLDAAIDAAGGGE